MVKGLMYNPIFCARKSEVTTKANLQVAQDLLDKLMMHMEICVCKAAIMIGVRKCIIAFLDESGRVLIQGSSAGVYLVMLNSENIKKDGCIQHRKRMPIASQWLVPKQMPQDHLSKASDIRDENVHEKLH